MVVGVVPEPATPESADLAEITGASWPEPMLNPATTESAAAATAPDAMKRLRPKYILGAATISGTTARGERQEAGVRTCGT